MNRNIWDDIKKEIALRIDAEPSLKDYLESLISHIELELR